MAGTTSQNEIKIKVEGAQGAISDLSKVDAYLKKVDTSIRRMSQSANACRLDTPLTALNKLGGEANASSQYMQTLAALMPGFSDLYSLGQEESNGQAKPLRMYPGLTQDDAKKWQTQLKDSREGPDGVLRGLITYYSEATDWATGFESLTKKSMTGVENAFVKMADTGKLSFAGMVDSIIADLIRLSVRASITGPLANLLSVGTGWLFGNTATTSVFENPISAPWAKNFQANLPLGLAHGGVLSGAGISAYSNQIINKPTFFGFDTLHPFARGGIMGENHGKAEAVMPLVRTSGGDLGVRAQRTDTSSSPQINVQVINQTGTGATAEASQQRNAQGGVDVVVLLKREIASDIARGGVIDQTIRGRYGVSPVVRGR